MKKRILSILLCCVLLAGLMPTVALADDGSGSNSREGWVELTKEILDTQYKVADTLGGYDYSLPSGKYYLGESISVDNVIYINKYDSRVAVTIDLNGFTVENNTNMVTILSIGLDSILTLMDSSAGKTGKVISSQNIAISMRRCTLNANGGTVSGRIRAYDNAKIDNTDASNVTTFTGSVDIYLTTINGGIFEGTVTNYGTISGGLFYGTVTNGTIDGKTVTFMNGTDKYALEVLSNGAVTYAPVAPPIPNGYTTFEGWYNVTDAFSFGSAITDDITLNAKFGNPVTYNIGYDLDGGQATNPATYNIESQDITLNNPTKPGYTFTGWSGTGLTGEDHMSVTIPTGSTGDRSYTAHFTSNSNYTVKFDTKGGNVVADKTGVLWTDKVLDGITAPTKDGYEFAGWKCGNTDVTDTTTYADLAGDDTVSDVTLVAQWNDKTAPVISGIEDGKTYCSAQTVTITEEYIDTVTVNGTAVTLDENNQLRLSPAKGKQTIVATDKAGNSATMTVTINDGHTPEADDGDCTTALKCSVCGENIKAGESAHRWSAWVKDNDRDTHTRKCQNADCKVSETKSCYGGKATCKEKAKCEICGAAYGDLNASQHANLKHVNAKAATDKAEGNKEYWHCEDCGKYFADQNGKMEIKREDTVIAKTTSSADTKKSTDTKTTDTKKSPQTGDNSNLALWIVLLILSGGIAAGAGIYRKKKLKRNN